MRNSLIILLIIHIVKAYFFFFQRIFSAASCVTDSFDRIPNENENVNLFFCFFRNFFRGASTADDKGVAMCYNIIYGINPEEGLYVHPHHERHVR